MSHIRACVVGSLAALLVACGVAAIPAAKGPLPDPATDDALSPTTGKRTIVLAGGCFWGMEEVFQHVRGVTDVTSGYAGGSARTANYEMVSTGTSGHAESVKIELRPVEDLVRPAAEGVLLGRPRSDAAQCAMARHRSAVSFGDFLRERTAAGAGEGLHQPVAERPRVRPPDRDGAGAALEVP